MPPKQLKKIHRLFQEPIGLIPSAYDQTRRIVILAVLFLVLLSAYFGFWYYPTVKVENNYIRKSNFRFVTEYWTEPKIRRLWQQENFKDIRADSQWGLFLKLCDWTHRQWKNGVPKPYPVCNALDILRDIRSGKTGGFCAQYAYVLGDVLKTFGFFNVRYVEATQSSGTGHFSLEAWSDEYEKWVLLGAWRDYYYVLEDSGIPANAYEVHLSLHGGPKVRAVSIDGKVVPDNYEACKLFDNIAVSLRSDFMDNTRPLSELDRWEMFLFIRDKYTSPIFQKSVPYHNVTERVEDLYFDCNKTRVEYQRDHNHVYLHLYNDRTASNFKCFVMRNGKGSEWTEISEDLVMDRQSGPQTFWLATRNQFNQTGVINRVDIHW